MKISLKSLLICLLVIYLAPSCKKEGCTDSAAKNYDAKAKKDNNTCNYEGSVVFWYGEDVSQALILNGVTSLKYFLDDQLIGSTSSDVYFTGAPDCGQNGSITSSKDLGTVKNKSYTYRVEDQLGIEHWEGTVNIEGGGCLKKELTF